VVCLFVLLELDPHRAERLVQRRFHRAERAAHRVRDVGERQVGQVSQHDRLSLAGRKGGDRVPNRQSRHDCTAGVDGDLLGGPAPFEPAPVVAQLIHRHDVDPAVRAIYVAHRPPTAERPGERFLGRVPCQLAIACSETDRPGDVVEVRGVEPVEVALLHRGRNGRRARKV